jgi:endogenous inhibitor of DNA gyrase (YacG/DUF329 family)
MWIVCPECGARLEVPANHPPRPFCSTRCKLIDLGRWMNEEIRIPVAAPLSTESNEEPS